MEWPIYSTPQPGQDGTPERRRGEKGKGPESGGKPKRVNFVSDRAGAV